MKNFDKFATNLIIFEICKILSTVHSKIFQDSQNADKTDKKNTSFDWISKCQKAFDELKKRINETFVLTHFNSELKTIVESKSSDYVFVGVFSQKGKDDIVRSVTFFSKTLLFAKYNYEIYDKKLLTIIKCFEE